MYNQYLKIKQSKIGKSVFCNMDIPANVPILEFGGEVYNKDIPPDQDVLQIGPNIYLSPSGNIGDKIKHSCNPNCHVHIVGTRAFLYSTYVIVANSELTFDYSTNSTDTIDSWQMQCNCGSFNCRKVISGFQYLTDPIKEEYKQKGLIPLFMIHNIFMKNK
jgi:hypothetical protein